MLVINPEECIDCGVCEPECPAEAIVLDVDLTEKQKPYLKLNIELAAVWKMINERRDPLPDAESWDGVEAKLKHLDRSSMLECTL